MTANRTLTCKVGQRPDGLSEWELDDEASKDGSAAGYCGNWVVWQLADKERRPASSAAELGTERRPSEAGAPLVSIA